MLSFTKGYHKLKIHKHSVTSPFKILEEFLEYIDAVSTNNRIMAVQELADLYGCIENEAIKHKLSMNDLKVMSDLTKKVFSDGTRTSMALIPYLKQNHDSIIAYGLGFIQVKCGNINYNFYHKDIERFESYGDPHSHQQDYVSEVLRGTITEHLYQVFPNHKSAPIKAYCGCGDTTLIKNLGYSLIKTENHVVNDIYLRLSSEYHSVEGLHGTVTKVTKFGNKDNAFVITEKPLKNVKTILPEKLWEMIDNLKLEGRV